MAESIPHEGVKKAEKAPANPAARTNLLLIVIIGVLALLLVVGIVGGIILIRNSDHGASAQTHANAAPANEAQGDKASAKSKEDDKKKAVKKDKDAPRAQALYVTLEPPFVVNFPPGKPAKFLQISMDIMTRDPAMAQFLKDNNPLLRNDLLMLFGNQEYESVVAPEGRESLRTLALETVRGVVKKEGGKPADVEAVYFTSLVMQ